MRRRDLAWDATHVRNGVHIRFASRTRGCDLAVDDGARDGPRCAGRKADAACDTKTHRIAREDVRIAFAQHEMHATCVSRARCLPRRSRRRPSRRPPRGPCDRFRGKEEASSPLPSSSTLRGSTATSHTRHRQASSRRARAHRHVRIARGPFVDRLWTAVFAITLPAKSDPCHPHQ